MNAYSANNAGGTLLDTYTLNFTVIDTSNGNGSGNGDGSGDGETGDGGDSGNGGGTGDGDGSGDNPGGETPISEGTEIAVTVPVLESGEGGRNNANNSRPATFRWTFESENGGDTIIGQYACGSYWIAPANGDSGIRIISLEGSGITGHVDLLSIDTDPIIERTGLLDGSNDYGNYDHDEDELPKLPKTFSPQSGSCISLVAAMQRNETQTGSSGTRSTNGESTDAYHIITLLPAPPAESDGTRPNITGASKSFHNWNDLQLDTLKKSSLFAELTSDELEEIRIRWTHNIGLFGLQYVNASGEGTSLSEGGRAYRAQLLADEYSMGMIATYNNDLISLLNSHNSMEEKKPAIAAMVAYGMDIYHCRFNHGTDSPKKWSSGAGQWMGNFTPVVTSVMLVNEEEMRHNVQEVAAFNHDTATNNTGPQELRQIFRGESGVLVWGDGHNPHRTNNTETLEVDRRYWADFVSSQCFIGAEGPCNPNVGKKTTADIYGGFIDGPSNAPGSSYMAVSSGGCRGIASCMLLMPEFRKLVNTDAPIEYAHRISSHGIWAYPDPVASRDIEEDSTCDVWRNRACSKYRITWGPRADDITKAVWNGIGRFDPDIYHGKTINILNDAPLVRSNWDSIFALYDGDTYEDRLVDFISTVVKPDIIIARGKAYIRSGSSDATLHYTLDGTTPTSSSPVYTEPFTLRNSGTLNVIAVDDTRSDSEVVSVNFGSISVGEIDANFGKFHISAMTDTTLTLKYSKSSENPDVTYVIEESTDLLRWAESTPYFIKLRQSRE